MCRACSQSATSNEELQMPAFATRHEARPEVHQSKAKVTRQRDLWGTRLCSGVLLGFTGHPDANHSEACNQYGKSQGPFCDRSKCRSLRIGDGLRSPKCFCRLCQIVAVQLRYKETKRHATDSGLVLSIRHLEFWLASDAELKCRWRSM